MNGPNRAAFVRFFKRYQAAFDAESELENKAFLAFEIAVLHLAGFTLDNQGLTPEQAKDLYQRFEAFENIWGDSGGELKFTRDQAVQRLDLELRAPIARPSIQ